MFLANFRFIHVITREPRQDIKGTDKYKISKQSLTFCLFYEFNAKMNVIPKIINSLHVG